MNQALGALSVDLLPRRVAAVRPHRTFRAGLVLGAFLGVAAVAFGPSIATTFSAATPAAAISASSTDEYAASHSSVDAPAVAGPATGSSTDEYSASHSFVEAAPSTSISGSSTDEYRAMYENR
jgi:hypothetical protein